MLDYVSEISYLFWSCVMSWEYLTCETVCYFIRQFHTPTHPFLNCCKSHFVSVYVLQVIKL